MKFSHLFYVKSRQEAIREDVLEFEYLATLRRMKKILQHRHHNPEDNQSCPNEVIFVKLRKEYKIYLNNCDNFKVYKRYQEEFQEKLNVVVKSCHAPVTLEE